MYKKASLENWIFSPDLNPVDYKVRGVMQQRVYETWIKCVEELKQRLVKVSHGLHQSDVESAVNESAGECWRKGTAF